jgi:hypothetical protein
MHTAAFIPYGECATVARAGHAHGCDGRARTRVDNLARRTHWYEHVPHRAERAHERHVALRTAGREGMEEDVDDGTSRSKRIDEVGFMVGVRREKVGALGEPCDAAAARARSTLCA